MTEPEIDQLVAAAVAGERRAVESLLKIIRPLVVRYCRPRIGGHDRSGASADDVAQEVCLAVLKALPGYQDQGRPFLAFVYGIASHKVVDAHRSASRDRSDPVEELPEEFDERDGPEQHAVNISESSDMKDLLALLPAKQREILVLRVVVGLSAEETAEAVGSTPGAVRVAQHRAVAKLRTIVSERDAAGMPPPAPLPPADQEPAARSRRPAAGSGRRTRLGPPDAEDWQAAPRTGDVVLDQLLDRADDHVATVSSGRGLHRVSEGPDPRVLREEDERMGRAARSFRPGRR